MSFRLSKGTQRKANSLYIHAIVTECSLQSEWMHLISYVKVLKYALIHLIIHPPSMRIPNTPPLTKSILFFLCEILSTLVCDSRFDQCVL